MKQYLPIKQSSMLIPLGIMNGVERKEHPTFLQLLLALHPLVIVVPSIGLGFMLGVICQICGFFK